MQKARKLINLMQSHFPFFLFPTTFFFNHFFMDIALFPNAVFRALEPTRKLPGSGQRPEKRWHWGNFFKLYDVLRPR